jgi:1,2-diacylglycerol 3-beta-galactosyltransferase
LNLHVIEVDPLCANDPLWFGSGIAARRHWIDGLIAGYGPLVVHAPWLWGVLYNLEALPGGLELFHFMYGDCLRARIRAAIAVSRPAAVVSVHPLVNHALADVIARGPWLPTMTVVTDLVDVHPWWICDRIDRFSTSTSAAAARVMAHGIDASRVAVRGQPIRTEFDSEPRERGAARQLLGMDSTTPVVLFMGGGDGAGRLCELVEACDRTVRRPNAPVPVDVPYREVQFVVVCGRNEHARRELSSVSWTAPTTIFGHVSNIPDLMAAADVIVTKPGPSTITEAMAMARPMLVGPPLPGQEDGNVPYVTGIGAALAFGRPEEAATLLQRLLAAPESVRHQMGAAGRTHFIPGSTLALTEAIAELASVPPPFPNDPIPVAVANDLSDRWFDLIPGSQPIR